MLQNKDKTSGYKYTTKTNFRAVVQRNKNDFRKYWYSIKIELLQSVKSKWQLCDHFWQKCFDD